MTNAKTFNGQVVPGDQSGRTIGIRTANFDPSVVASEHLEKGVYASEVSFGGRVFKGVLFYGPRLVKGETHDVLEIHIIGFEGDIYNEILTFTVGKYIRPVMNFASMDRMAEQIREDIRVVTASS